MMIGWSSIPMLCSISLLLSFVSVPLVLPSSNSERVVFSPKHQKPYLFYSGKESAETLSWVVKLKNDVFPSVEELDTIADVIAEDTQLLNLGQVGELRGHYLFASPLNRHILKLFKSDTTSLQFSHDMAPIFLRESFTLTSQGNLTHSDWHHLKLKFMMSLDAHRYVDWHIQQLIRTRSKRDLTDAERMISEGGNTYTATRLHLKIEKRNAASDDPYNPYQFNDPLFSKQWHLVNTLNRGSDINVTGVWLHNITGYGVTVAVVDDGLEWQNPDLIANYNPDGSFDLNSNDADPSPSSSKDTNHHGTRCAGEIAAVANNEVCGVGVAYRARISGIRILDGPMTDDLEAVAFTKKLDINDIYSCSWGPEDDGKTVDGPQHLAMTAMRHGVENGRGGYGAIYVVASGNGGRVNDNCNYDGYANSIYTVTIGAIDEDGEMPYYGEPCASMLAVTYSSGVYQRSIVTTDWTRNGGTGCTESHSGTSAAAPIASSLIALMLEARPCLTWRDVQYIIAVTAVKVDVLKSEWVRNAAGLYHSHQHGFGEMKAWRMVNTAKIWKPVPWLTLFTSEEIHADLDIPSTGSVESKFNVTADMLDGYYLNTLEYVHVKITLSHEHRGDISIELICPSKTGSVIGATRKLDESKDGFKGWIFSTVRCWGETPEGTWTLKITDIGSSGFQSRGMLIKWQLQLYGSMMTSTEVAERIRLVNEASSGIYLNASFQLPCPPPLVQTKPVEPISERLLKVLLMMGCFLMFMTLCETLEYAFCYNEEKKEHSNMLRLNEHARQLMGEGSPDEVTQLLPAEEIEMDTVLVERDLLVTQVNAAASSQEEINYEKDLLLELDEELNKQETLLHHEAMNKHVPVINKSSDGCYHKATEELLIALKEELVLDMPDSETASCLLR